MSSNSKVATLADAVPQVVPEYLKTNKFHGGLQGKREVVRIISDVTNYTPSQPKIRFTLNNDELYDYSRGAMFMDVTVSATGGTYARLANGAWTLFNRYRCLALSLIHISEPTRPY